VNKKADPIILYTDGACDPNPGPGGWGVILLYQGHYKELSGGDPQTTNNRMEMTAAIEGLHALKRSCEVRVYTDSQYLKNGITSWLPQWKRRGWRRKTGGVKNIDLWKVLDTLTQRHRVEWHWIRGHAGDLLNERCDELANEALRRVRRDPGAVRR
jgi:ribonuclease HI